jgi:cytidine deaminase
MSGRKPICRHGLAGLSAADEWALVQTVDRALRRGESVVVSIDGRVHARLLPEPISHRDERATDADLLRAARAAIEHAYAPHSGFRVGAAVLGPDGRIVATGCNIENASYGVTVCAERTAIFSAVAAGERELIKLAVTDSSDDEDPAGHMSCGPCLQVMAEFMAPDAEVIVDRVGVFRLAELLPKPFALRADGGGMPSTTPKAG